MNSTTRERRRAPNEVRLGRDGQRRALDRSCGRDERLLDLGNRQRRGSGGPRLLCPVLRRLGLNEPSRRRPRQLPPVVGRCAHGGRRTSSGRATLDTGGGQGGGRYPVPKVSYVPESRLSTPGSSGVRTNTPFGRPLSVMITRCFAAPGRETLPTRFAYHQALCPPAGKRPPPPVTCAYWPVIGKAVAG